MCISYAPDTVTARAPGCLIVASTSPRKVARGEGRVGVCISYAPDNVAPRARVVAQLLSAQAVSGCALRTPPTAF